MCLLQRLSARGRPGLRWTAPVNMTPKAGIPKFMKVFFPWTSQTYLGWAETSEPEEPPELVFRPVY